MNALLLTESEKVKLCRVIEDWLIANRPPQPGYVYDIAISVRKTSIVALDTGDSIDFKLASPASDLKIVGASRYVKRIRQAILDGQYGTIGDIVRRNDSHFLKYRNFGKKTLLALKESLQEIGLDLGMKVPLGPRETRIYSARALPPAGPSEVDAILEAAGIRTYKDAYELSPELKTSLEESLSRMRPGSEPGYSYLKDWLKRLPTGAERLADILKHFENYGF